MRFRAAIVGCGGISAMHAENYGRSSGAALVAAADLSPAAIEKFAGQHPGVKTYLSVEEMLQQERPDIVSICTPPSFHTGPALAVAHAGVKGMLLEKPMALHLADADEILAACRDHHVTLAVGHQLRCSAPYRTGRQLVIDGAIGGLERVWGVCHRAPLQTNATHTIDLMRYLAGDLPVDWVMGSVETGPGRLQEGFPQEDAGLGFFQFREGPVALIEAGDLPPYRGYHRIFLEGTDGQVELTRPGGPSLRLRSAATGGEWQTPALLPELNPVDDLVEAIRTGGQPLSSGDQGRMTLELILGLFESARTHRRVTLPLENRQNPLAQIYVQQGSGTPQE